MANSDSPGPSSRVPWYLLGAAVTIFGVIMGWRLYDTSAEMRDLRERIRATERSQVDHDRRIDTIEMDHRNLRIFLDRHERWHWRHDAEPDVDGD